MKLFGIIITLFPMFSASAQKEPVDSNKCQRGIFFNEDVQRTKDFFQQFVDADNLARETLEKEIDELNWNIISNKQDIVTSEANYDNDWGSDTGMENVTAIIEQIGDILDDEIFVIETMNPNNLKREVGAIPVLKSDWKPGEQIVDFEDFVLNAPIARHHFNSLSIIHDPSKNGLDDFGSLLTNWWTIFDTFDNQIRKIQEMYENVPDEFYSDWSKIDLSGGVLSLLKNVVDNKLPNIIDNANKLEGKQEQEDEFKAAISDLNAALAEATELRQSESAQNDQTLKDAKEALDATEQAITVIQSWSENNAVAISDVSDTKRHIYNGHPAEIIKEKLEKFIHNLDRSSNDRILKDRLEALDSRMDVAPALLYDVSQPVNNGNNRRRLVTSVQKVIELLDGLVEKTKKDQSNLKTEYASHTTKNVYEGDINFSNNVSYILDKYKTKTADTTKKLCEYAHTDVVDVGENLNKFMLKFKDPSSDLANEYDKFVTERNKQKTSYENGHSSVAKEIDQITRAISVLKKQGYDRKQGDSTRRRRLRSDRRLSDYNDQVKAIKAKIADITAEIAKEKSEQENCTSALDDIEENINFHTDDLAQNRKNILEKLVDIVKGSFDYFISWNNGNLQNIAKIRTEAAGVYKTMDEKAIQYKQGLAEYKTELSQTIRDFRNERLIRICEKAEYILTEQIGLQSIGFGGDFPINDKIVDRKAEKGSVEENIAELTEALGQKNKEKQDAEVEIAEATTKRAEEHKAYLDNREFFDRALTCAKNAHTVLKDSPKNAPQATRRLSENLKWQDIQHKDAPHPEHMSEAMKTVYNNNKNMIDGLIGDGGGKHFKGLQMEIDEMIATLDGEGAHEDKHIDWCNDELNYNNYDQAEKTANILRLKAEIAVHDAKIDRQIKAVDDAAAEHAELQTQMKRAVEDLRATWTIIKLRTIPHLKLSYDEQIKNAKTHTERAELERERDEKVKYWEDHYGWDPEVNPPCSGDTQNEITEEFQNSKNPYSILPPKEEGTAIQWLKNAIDTPGNILVNFGMEAKEMSSREYEAENGVLTPDHQYNRFGSTVGWKAGDPDHRYGVPMDPFSAKIGSGDMPNAKYRCIMNIPFIEDLLKNDIMGKLKEKEEAEQAEADAKDEKNEAEDELAMYKTDLQDLETKNSELHKKCDFFLQNKKIRKEAREAEHDALISAKTHLNRCSSDISGRRRRLSGGDPQTPEAYAYEFHSAGIIESLAVVVEELEKIPHELEEEEVNEREAHAAAVAANNITIAILSQDIGYKSREKAELESRLRVLSSDLADDEADLKAITNKFNGRVTFLKNTKEELERRCKADGGPVHDSENSLKENGAYFGWVIKVANMYRAVPKESAQTVPDGYWPPEPDGGDFFKDYNTFAEPKLAGEWAIMSDLITDYYILDKLVDKLEKRAFGTEEQLSESDMNDLVYKLHHDLEGDLTEMDQGTKKYEIIERRVNIQSRIFSGVLGIFHLQTLIDEAEHYRLRIHNFLTKADHLEDVLRDISIYIQKQIDGNFEDVINNDIDGKPVESTAIQNKYFIATLKNIQDQFLDKNTGILYWENLKGDLVSLNKDVNSFLAVGSKIADSVMDLESFRGELSGKQSEFHEYMQKTSAEHQKSEKDLIDGTTDSITEAKGYANNTQTSKQLLKLRNVLPLFEEYNRINFKHGDTFWYLHGKGDGLGLAPNALTLEYAKYLRDQMDDSPEKTAIEATIMELDTAYKTRTPAEEELAAVEKENVGVNERCDFLLDNYEVRQAAMSEEKEALEEAKAILSGPKSRRLAADDGLPDPEELKELNAYEFRSGDIIENLEEVLKKKQSELTKLEKDELVKQNEYNLTLIRKYSSMSEGDTKTLTDLRVEYESNYNQVCPFVEGFYVARTISSRGFDFNYDLKDELAGSDLYASITSYVEEQNYLKERIEFEFPAIKNFLAENFQTYELGIGLRGMELIYQQWADEIDLRFPAYSYPTYEYIKAEYVQNNPQFFEGFKTMLQEVIKIVKSDEISGHANEHMPGDLPARRRLVSIDYGPDIGGITGIMEVIQSDWSRLISETEAEESAAQAEYVKFESDTNTDVAEKKTRVEYLSKARESLLKEREELGLDFTSLSNKIDKLKGVADDFANNYVHKLAAIFDKVLNANRLLEQGFNNCLLGQKTKEIRENIKDLCRSLKSYPPKCTDGCSSLKLYKKVDGLNCEDVPEIITALSDFYNQLPDLDQYNLEAKNWPCVEPAYMKFSFIRRNEEPRSWPRVITGIENIGDLSFRLNNITKEKEQVYPKLKDELEKYYTVTSEVQQKATHDLMEHIATKKGEIEAKQESIKDKEEKLGNFPYGNPAALEAWEVARSNLRIVAMNARHNNLCYTGDPVDPCVMDGSAGRNVVVDGLRKEKEAAEQFSGPTGPLSNGKVDSLQLADSVKQLFVDYINIIDAEIEEKEHVPLGGKYCLVSLDGSEPTWSDCLYDDLSECEGARENPEELRESNVDYLDQLTKITTEYQKAITSIEGQRDDSSFNYVVKKAEAEKKYREELAELGESGGVKVASQCVRAVCLATKSCDDTVGNLHLSDEDLEKLDNPDLDSTIVYDKIWKDWLDSATSTLMERTLVDSDKRCREGGDIVDVRWDIHRGTAEQSFFRYLYDNGGFHFSSGENDIELQIVETKLKDEPSRENRAKMESLLLKKNIEDAFELCRAMEIHISDEMIELIDPADLINGPPSSEIVFTMLGGIGEEPSRIDLKCEHRFPIIKSS